MGVDRSNSSKKLTQPKDTASDSQAEQPADSFCGPVWPPLQETASEEIILSTIGKVTAVTRRAFLATLKRSDGGRMDVKLSKSIVVGKALRPGDFIKYEIFTENADQKHRASWMPPPKLSDEQLKKISDFVDSLDFLAE
jgi:hypothetical protein